MRYPSKYVLITDLDDPQFSLEKFTDVSHSLLGTKGPSGNDLGNPLSMHISQTSATILSERAWQESVLNHTGGLLQTSSPRSSSSNDETSPNSSTPTSFSSSSQSSASNTSLESSNIWEYQDPTLKNICVCAK